MNNKISLQDLAQGLAKSKKMTRKDAETFIHKVFEVIEECVMADETVKVKGLGTFKLNTVDSRESVNVATGERFVIDTHSKISFTPHPTLRDAVNRPFSDFETVAISDNVKTEDMEYIPQAMPIEETSEPVVEPSAEEPAPVEEASEPVEEEKPIEQPEPEPVAEAAEPVAEDEPTVDAAPLVAEEPEPAEESTAPVAEEPTPEPAVAEAPVEEVAPIAEPSVEEEPVPEVLNEHSRRLANLALAESNGKACFHTAEAKSKCPRDNVASQPTDEVTPQNSAVGTEHSNEPTSQTTSSSKKGTIIAVVSCLVVLCILFFVFWYPNKPTEGEAATVAEQTAAAQEESTAEEASAPEVVELTPEEAAEKYPQVEDGEYLIVGTKEEYTLQKGDDLFKLSRGVYGDKKFAPYIIIYNNLKNPNHIEIGDVLKFPELRKKE